MGAFLWSHYSLYNTAEPFLHSNLLLVFSFQEKLHYMWWELWYNICVLYATMIYQCSIEYALLVNSNGDLHKILSQVEKLPFQREILKWILWFLIAGNPIRRFYTTNISFTWRRLGCVLLDCMLSVKKALSSSQKSLQTLYPQLVLYCIHHQNSKIKVIT